MCEDEEYARAQTTVFMNSRGNAMLTPAIFRPLYLAMVRPRPDYAVKESFPYLQKDIELTERMQRLATRSVKRRDMLEPKLPSS